MQHDILNTEVTTIDGEKTTLASFAGKVLLIVNVASKCGLTPQYEQLEDLQKQFAAEGYIVETKCEGRRRSYVLTEKGEERLHGEMDRLTAQMNDYQRLLKGGDKPCELTDGTRSGN